MSWRNTKLIFWREVRDQLRDRRTLFMIAVLPLLLYPALGIGMVQMKLLFHEQPRTIVLLGHEHLPTEPELVLGSEKLHVITDADDQSRGVDFNPREERGEAAGSEQGGSPAASPPGLRKASDPATRDGSDPKQPDGEQAELLAQARKIRDQLRRIEEIEVALQQAQRANHQSEARRQEEKLAALKKELSELFSASRMQVLIIVPEGFGEEIERTNRRLAERAAGVKIFSEDQRPKIIQNSADQKSAIAYERVLAAMERWEKQLLKQRLEIADLPETWSAPVNPEYVDLAGKEQQSAIIWSMLFPALLVVMSVTGAFYPAVDVVAGEKERGTMETLLICPATRTEIVLGKFLTVMLFSMSTALLNLLSMGLTGNYIFSMGASSAIAGMGNLSAPSPAALLWVIVLLIPLAALFSALSLALATFARSSKEGQYYLTPLLMVTLGLTVFCLAPGVEITAFYSVMPIVGVALLLKELIASPWNADALLFAVPVLVTSVGYSLLALWWAIDQFNREEVLFREAERFELRSWIRHLLRDKEPTPSFTEAGVCFVLIMLLQFGAMKFMQDALFNVPEGMKGAMMMRLLIIQQLVIIATPALLMGTILTTSAVRTFRLRLPGWQFLAAAAVLPLLLHPLSLELSMVLNESFFPALPPEIQEVGKMMADSAQSIWVVLLTFALVPAVCEEVAFRGFILSGFGHSRRMWLAIGLSSLTFGIMHMFPQQVFNAMLLGVVLGLLAVRSNSLLPPIVFHVLYNSLGVLHGRVSASGLPEGLSLDWFVTMSENILRYRWPTLVVAALVAAVLLRWLVNHSRPFRPAAPEAPQRLPAEQADHRDANAPAGKPPVRIG